MFLSPSASEKGERRVAASADDNQRQEGAVGDITAESLQFLLMAPGQRAFG